MAIRGFLEDWISAYDGLEVEPEEVVDLDNGVVFAAARLTGRLARSSDNVLTAHRPFVFVWVENIVERVVVPASDVEAGRAAAERLAEERG